MTDDKSISHILHVYNGGKKKLKFLLSRIANK